jgi:hypothetical protein
MRKPAAWFALGSLLVLTLAVAGITAIALLAGDEGRYGEPELSGDDEFRAFAAKLQLALDAKDLQFIAQRMETTHVVCTAQDVRGNTGGPQCDAEGTSYDGFPVAYWRSEGAIVPDSSVLHQLRTLFGTAQPAATDDFGDGRTRVYALDLPPGKSHAIITAIIVRPPDFGPGGPLRIAIGTAWSFSNGQWRFTSMLQAYSSAEEVLLPCQEVLAFLGGAWERYPGPAASDPATGRCPLPPPPAGT